MLCNDAVRIVTFKGKPGRTRVDVSGISSQKVPSGFHTRVKFPVKSPGFGLHNHSPRFRLPQRAQTWFFG
jgi:hypothetical protein